MGEMEWVDFDPFRASKKSLLLAFNRFLALFWIDEIVK